MNPNKEQQYIEALKQAAQKIKELSTKAQAPTGKLIAVVGIGCRYPGGVDNPDRFWELLERGVDTSSTMPVDRFSGGLSEGEIVRMVDEYRMRGCFVEDLEQFDPTFFNITPNEAVSIDPHHRLLLETSWQAFENAGIDPAAYRGSKTGVYVGISAFDYARAQLLAGDYEAINAYSLNGVTLNAASGRLSYFYDFNGPTISSDTACSSGLTALNQAMHSLYHREIDMALVCGVNCILLPEPFISLTKMGAISPTGECRAFDDGANGFVRGEGCGVVILKRVADAERDNNPVSAIIRGMAINNDGRSNGLTAPNGLAQERVIRDALKAANVSADEIDYIEAHGTGTNLGDPVEVDALNRVFNNRAKDNPLLIGSVKTNIGHQESGAGLAGLIKVILAFQHQRIPKSLHYDTPNRHIVWNSIPIRVNGESTEWQKSQKIRLAGVSSFGFSGTNTHVIVQEPDPVKTDEESGLERPRHILAVSAKDERGFRELTGEHLDALGKLDGNDPGDYCFSVNSGRTHFPVRKAWQAGSLSEMRDQIAEWNSGNEKPSRASQSRRNKLAFLFTGQGSQYKKMGEGLWNGSPTFREHLLQCEELFEPLIEAKVTELLYSDSVAEKVLNQTLYTQSILFSFGYALAKLLMEWGIEPELMIGHSIGEYTAAAIGGVFDLETAVQIVAARCRAMNALPEGGEDVCDYHRLGAGGTVYRTIPG